MTEGLLVNRRLRVVLVGVLIAVSSIIKGATGQSLELGCPLKVQFTSCHFEQAQLIIYHHPGYHRPVSMEGISQQGGGGCRGGSKGQVQPHQPRQQACQLRQQSPHRQLLW